VDDELLVRLALAEAELARERRKSRVKGGAMVKWSDLERELARHALESLSGGGDRNR
jgi:hypothetical protein